MEAINEIIFAAQNATGLVAVIKWIIQIGSSIALGIILFTLFLKIITLPFDAISRIQMRKNSLIMEEMRPELEKLQKQYANDKQLYSQKMMALYKKNGYSMFGACLPTIATLVIFIVAINAFNDYSRYQNKVDFWEMSKAYNNAIYQGITIDDDFIKIDGTTGFLVYDNYKIINADEQTLKDKNYEVVKGVKDGTTYYSICSTTLNSYTLYEQTYSGDGENIKIESKGSYKIDQEKLKLTDYKVDGKTFSESEISATEFIKKLGSEYSYQKYKNDIKPKNQFLWVKNVWVTDSPLAKPVEKTWENFKTTHGYKVEDNQQSNMDDETYGLLIANFPAEETDAINGYFILAILTAGLSFLTQFVMSKSQKASMELQTVDGQGAQTQKIMMWLMPIMMAIFSFMYTASFSIYMVVSSVLSIVFTLSINYIIDKRFKKKAAVGKDPDKIRGRIYTPEVKVEEPKKKQKASKEPDGPDFIKGEKKYIRGRLK